MITWTATNSHCVHTCLIAQSKEENLHKINNLIGRRVRKMPRLSKWVGSHEVHAMDMRMWFLHSICFKHLHSSRKIPPQKPISWNQMTNVAQTPFSPPFANENTNWCNSTILHHPTLLVKWKLLKLCTFEAQGGFDFQYSSYIKFSWPPHIMPSSVKYSSHLKCKIIPFKYFLCHVRFLSHLH